MTTSAEILDASALVRHASQVAARRRPPPPQGIEQKHRWTQVVLQNHSQFRILSCDTSLETGQYKAPPRECEPFAQMAFSACNKDAHPMGGAAGRAAFRVHLDQSHGYNFAVEWTASVTGAYRVSLVRSSSAEDGDDSTTGPERTNVLTHDSEGQDRSGRQVRFRLKISVVLAVEHHALILVDQEILHDLNRMKYAEGTIENVCEPGSETSCILRATFNVGDTPFHFIGKYTPNMIQWSSANATLEYLDERALTSLRLYYGKVVASGLDITLEENVKITGVFDVSIAAEDAATVGGAGMWAQFSGSLCGCQNPPAPVESAVVFS